VVGIEARDQCELPRKELALWLTEVKTKEIYGLSLFRLKIDVWHPQQRIMISAEVLSAHNKGWAKIEITAHRHHH
jgi:hypothetical protein